MANFTIENSAMAMRNGMRMVALLLVTLLLTACGFHMRGQSGMPFEKLHIETADQGTPFIAELTRSLEANRVKLVDTAGQADVVLDIVSEVSDKQILTLGGDGRVNEFRLSFRVSMRAYDQQQRDWIPAEDIALLLVIGS